MSTEEPKDKIDTVVGAAGLSYEELLVKHNTKVRVSDLSQSLLHEMDTLGCGVLFIKCRYRDTATALAKELNGNPSLYVPEVLAYNAPDGRRIYRLIVERVRG